MSRTPLSLAGFQVILSGRFWVIAEAEQTFSRPCLCFPSALARYSMAMVERSLFSLALRSVGVEKGLCGIGSWRVSAPARRELLAKMETKLLPAAVVLALG